MDNISQLFQRCPLLNELFLDLNITALDVGARKGIADDLRPISPWVNVVGFEPDIQECSRLNESIDHDSRWKGIRFVPAALGKEGPGVLHLCRAPGCSSLLSPNRRIIERFRKGHEFDVTESINIDVETLGNAAKRYGFEEAVYIKVDIQGGEKEFFDGGRPLLTSKVRVIRTEASYYRFYQGQPLAFELEGDLRELGYQPIAFPETHSWRRATTRNPEKLDLGAPFVYSRGELAHGDMLFFRDPAPSDYEDPTQKDGILGMALIAIGLGYIDYAFHVLEPMVNQKKTLISEFSYISKQLGRRRALRDLKVALRKGEIATKNFFLSFYP